MLHDIVDAGKPLIHNELFVALLGAVIAGFLSYLFGLKAQARLIKTQTKLEIYKDFWKARDEVSYGLIDFSVKLQGFPTQLVTMRSIDNSKKIMKGITNKPDHEYDFEIRQKWNEYLTDLAESGNDITGKFGRLHSLVEQSYFMYPNLEDSFKLLLEENGKIFTAQFDLMAELYKPDAISLLETKGEKALQKVIDDSKCVELCMDMIVYIIDFFALLQEDLVGDVFKFEARERKPIEGKVLTRKGWKDITK